MIDPEQERLLAAIAVAPVADVTPWLAYADWLDARHDRRGDVIRQSVADKARNWLERVEREKRISPLYGDDLMSPRLRAQARYWRFVWSRGFITGASLRWRDDDSPPQEAVEALVDDPHASRLKLTLVDQFILKQFGPAETPLEHLRRRHQASRTLWWALLSRSHPNVQSLHAWGLDHAGIDRLDQLPALESLELDGDAAVTRIGHPRVRELHGSGQPIANAAEIDLPELELLSWSAGLPPITLLEHPPTKLAEIAIFPHTDADAIARSALASQIRVIYTMANVVRTSLASRVKCFPALHRLVVSASSRVLDELRRELPDVEIVDDSPSADRVAEVDKIDPI